MHSALEGNALMSLAKQSGDHFFFQLTRMLNIFLIFTIEELPTMASGMNTNYKRENIYVVVTQK